MIYSVLDLGTNTFSLLVAQFEHGLIKPIYRTSIAVKLGEGGINEGVIRPEPFKRGIAAIQQLYLLAKDHGSKHIFAVATSAIRSASNKQDFLDEVFSLTNISIEVINGEEEAELIYKGVMNSIPFTDPVLIMDIGGGSTEFIIGDKEGIFWKKSYDLGVARILDLIKPSNPIKEEEVMHVNNLFLNVLHELKTHSAQHSLNTLIGVAGPFESYIEMISSKFNQPYEPSNAYLEIDLTKSKTIHNELISSTYNDRLRMDGLLDYRADMMVLSSIFIQFIIGYLNISEVFVSTATLKEGVIYSLKDR